MKRILVVGPGPVRPGVTPGASVIAAEMAEALAAAKHEVVALDSAPDSALLWAKGCVRHHVGPIDIETVRRIALAEKVDAIALDAAGRVRLGEGTWLGVTPHELAFVATGGAIDVVCASDGTTSIALAAFSCSAEVAIADATARAIDVPPGVRFEGRGVGTVRGVLENGRFVALSTDRGDTSLFGVAGLVRGIRVGTLLGSLLAGHSIDEALQHGEALPLASVVRIPDTDFAAWPGANATLGRIAKTFSACIKAAPPIVPTKTSRRVLVVGPDCASSGTSAAAVRLAAREVTKLGFEAVVSTSSEGSDMLAVRTHYGRSTEEVILAESPDDVLVGFGTVTAEDDAPAPPDAIELHVLLLADGAAAQILGTFEHVERSAVHSDDAAAISPSLVVPEPLVRRAEDLALALAASKRGLVTARFAIGGSVELLGVSVGITTHALSLGLVLGIDLVAAAVRISLGNSRDLGPVAAPRQIAIEEHVFPFAALGAADTKLDRRPRSTGSVLAIGETVAQTYANALASMGIRFHRSANRPFLLSSTEAQASTVADLGRRLFALGFDIVATRPNAAWLEKLRVPHTVTDDPAAATKNCAAVVAASPDDGPLRRAALVAGVPCFTTVDLAKVATAALELES